MPIFELPHTAASLVSLPYCNSDTSGQTHPKALGDGALVA
jgi:hypothetical protein